MFLESSHGNNRGRQAEMKNSPHLPTSYDGMEKVTLNFITRVDIYLFCMSSLYFGLETEGYMT